MLGFQLFYDALATMVRRFFRLIGVSILPMILMVFIYFSIEELRYLSLHPNLYFLLWTLFFALFAFPVGWGAINWHRSVILSENRIFRPYIKDSSLFSYVWRFWVLLIVLSIASVIFLGAIDMIFSSRISMRINDLIIGISALCLTLIYHFSIVFLYMRLGTALTGIAVGDKTTFRQSWTLTRNYNGTILVIAFAFLLFITVTSVLLGAFASGEIWAILSTLYLLAALVFTCMGEFYSYIRAQNDVSEIFG